MEYQVKIIYILVFCFNIVEPNPYSDEGRYGAQEASNWSTNPKQPRQYQNQNYARPQNFYPSVKNTNNRSYNPDSRYYENQHSTLSNALGEKKPFYEGPNGRSKPYYQPPVSTLTGGRNFKEKSTLDAVPQSYRPMRQYYDYADKTNERNTPPVDRYYQQPVNRPYYNTRVPYHRSVSENYGNRFKESLSQKPIYYENDNRYSYQQRALPPMPEHLKPTSNVIYKSMPELPIPSQPKRDINEILSDPKIQNYLSSNHKRYLVLHSNGTVEHIDNLESIVQSYPNYVMVKAGEIITNPKNSTLELPSPVSMEENVHSKIPEVDKNPLERNSFPTHRYNLPAVHTTEKAYIQPTDRTVDISHEYGGVSDDAIFATSTSALVESSTYLTEAETEEYTTPLVETSTEYNTLIPLLEYDTQVPYIITTEYTPNNFDKTSDYVTYTDTNSNYVTSTVPIAVHEGQSFLENFTEIATEDLSTEGQIAMTTEGYTTFAPVFIAPNEESLDNATSVESSKVIQDEKEKDIITKLFNYPSTLGKFLQHYLRLLFPHDKLNNDNKTKIARRIREVASANDSFVVSDIIEAITQLTMTDTSTTDTSEMLFTTDDPNTYTTKDFIYTTPSPLETVTSSDDYYTSNLETPLYFDETEKEENLKGKNPFVDMGDVINSYPIGERNGYQNSNQDSTSSDDSNDSSTSYPMSDNSTNPFIITNTSYSSDGRKAEDKLLSSTETETYRASPSIENTNEDETNPFIESTTQENIKPRRRTRQKKKLKPTTQIYNDDSLNPFILNTKKTNTIVDESDYISETSVLNTKKMVSNPFSETNPFIEPQNYDDYVINPFTENYADEVTTLSTVETETDDASLDYDSAGMSYETGIVPSAYLPNETNTTSNQDYAAKTESDDYNEVVSAITTTEVFTTTEEPAVWFKVDATLWEKLSNGTVPYDVVYFFQVNDQPLVEKDTKTTIFPNGTIVQELIETVWEREGDTKPIIVKSSKTIYPEEEP